MAPLQTPSWKATVTPGITMTFVNEFTYSPSIIPDLYDVKPSTMYREVAQTYAGAGNLQKYTSSSIPKLSGQQAYSKTFTHDKFGGIIDIEYELYKDDMYNVIKPQIIDLARSARRTREESAVDLFNHAFDTSYTVADSLSLCSTAHTSPVPGVANQSNSGTSALSYNSYVAARNAMRKFKGYNDEKLSILGDTLLVPIDLSETAIGITESQLKDANFQVNVINNSWKPRVIISEYLSDANNWFLMCRKYLKMHNLWFNREPLKLFDDASTSNMVLSFAAYMRYSFGSVDFKWIYGNNVSGG